MVRRPDRMKRTGVFDIPYRIAGLICVARKPTRHPVLFRESKRRAPVGGQLNQFIYHLVLTFIIIISFCKKNLNYRTAVRAAQSASRIWVPGGFSDCQRLLVRSFSLASITFRAQLRVDARRCLSRHCLPATRWVDPFNSS